MNDTNFEERQAQLIKFFLNEIKKSNDIIYINECLCKINGLISLLDTYPKWQQELLETWGTLEIINAIMLAENRYSFTKEEEEQRIIAFNEFYSLLNLSPFNK